MSTEARNFTDVTLIQEDRHQSLCKFNQTSYANLTRNATKCTIRKFALRSAVQGPLVFSDIQRSVNICLANVNLVRTVLFTIKRMIQSNYTGEQGPFPSIA